jgi:CRISPR-associated protein (TIGR02584 family)
MESVKLKTILTAVIGATPQVLTESLYDLLITRGETVDEVHVITTAFGKKQIQQLLLNRGEGALYRFCRDYDYDESNLLPRIRVITGADGSELEDIRSVADNRAAANFITAAVQEQCSIPDSRVLASLAGGRKTMSTYMGFAMQLFARPQDRLFHVLIAPKELEFNPNFFYPPPGEGDVEVAGKDDTRLRIPRQQLVLTQAEINFIRLSGQIPKFSPATALHFDQMVALTQKELDRTPVITGIVADPGRKSLEIITVNERITVKLKPQELYFYAYTALHGPVPVQLPLSAGPQNVARDLLNFYNENSPGRKYSELSFSTERLWQMRSSINRALQAQLNNPYLFSLVGMDSSDGAYGAEYHIRIDPEKVTLAP